MRGMGCILGISVLRVVPADKFNVLCVTGVSVLMCFVVAVSVGVTFGFTRLLQFDVC